jgi:hypothetical protein
VEKYMETGFFQGKKAVVGSDLRREKRLWREGW